MLVDRFKDYLAQDLKEKLIWMQDNSPIQKEDNGAGFNMEDAIPNFSAFRVAGSFTGPVTNL